MQYALTALRVSLSCVPTLRCIHGPPLSLGQQLCWLLQLEIVCPILRVRHNHTRLCLDRDDKIVQRVTIRRRLALNNQPDDSGCRIHTHSKLAGLFVHPSCVLRSDCRYFA